ncbi:MAG: DUF4175 family protein [Phycisphaeraceae bacterium]
MTTLNTPKTIPSGRLDQRLRSVWAREQKLHLLAGLLAFCRWAVPMFLLGVLIDWVTYMPAPGRAAIAALLLVVSLVRAWRVGWRHVRPFNALHTALRLEQRRGDRDSLLVSALQLRDDSATVGGSASLREHTCQQAERAAEGVRPERAVPYRPLARPGMVAAVLLAVIAAFALVNNAFFAAGVTRLFTPWVFAEYPTDTRIQLTQHELVIQEGAAGQIVAQIAGVVPEQATIQVRTGGGDARAIDLPVTNDRCVYDIASASRDFTYRVKAGDDRTAWHRVRVVPAPRIDRVDVELRYPDYLQKEDQTLRALTFTAPEGATVNWRITLDRPIRAAQFVGDGQPPTDLDVGADGRTVTLSEAVSASRGYQFTWVDREHGFRFTSPRYYLQVASDQAPRIELTEPASNLVAMPGRPIRLAIRAQDDHGIAAAVVAYRVNQRAEQQASLDDAAGQTRGGRAIDWDYREAIADLGVGDTVSFAVEVRDRYPGPAGPHVVRTDTRRVTFVSEAQYFEQIDKQTDRLLSRVQGLYRQQRAAHDAVRALSPDAGGYAQACQLEAIRQEMLRDQLNDIADAMQALLDDLAANGVADAPQAESLGQLRASLMKIAESQVALAADRLREQSGLLGDRRASADIRPAEHAVNAAARALGSLVLLRGIDAAQEVFAREARVLATAQAELRWRTATQATPGLAAGLGKQQDELARWAEQLTAALRAGMRYDKRPLAVLRLTRSIKDLDERETAARMRLAGEHLRAGEATQAAALQADLVRDLLNAEFSVRLGGAYATLLKTRNRLVALSEAQARLQEEGEAMSPKAFGVQRPALSSRQAALRKELLTLLLPTVPAPRARLFDESPPQPPPVEALLSRADRAMDRALAGLDAGDRAAVLAGQQQAGQTLAELAGVVDRWSVQMGLQTQGLGTLVAATSERLSGIEAFEARVIALLEKTDIAAAEERPVAGLAESQAILADELAGLVRQLRRDNLAQPDPDLPPLLSRLDRAERAMRAAADALGNNQPDPALTGQERAADALAEAYALVLTQNERLSKLQDLLMFQRAVGFANGYMADIVAEQRDLITATESAGDADVERLMPVFDNMRQCMIEVAPLLNLVAGRLDVGTPLVFAQTDFEDAVAALRAGDKLDAIDAQDVAAQSLAEVQSRVAAITAQTGYVAEIVELLHAQASNAAALGDLQDALRRQAMLQDQARRDGVLEAQRALLAEAERSGRLLTAAAGTPGFDAPAERMREALDHIEAGETDEAHEQMGLAATALGGNAESLAVLIGMLHGLPSIEINAQTEPALVRLIDVLTLASAHKTLLRRTADADAGALPPLAEAQRRLASRGAEVARAGETHALLNAAHKQLGLAAAALESPDPDRDAIAQHQRAADTHLRHFIVEQALVLETAIQIAPSDGDPGDDGEGSDSESALTAGFISDFVSGETPQDKRTEWKVLADRNRAALNQNFARELPLEYRRLLKDYYERVAE